MALVRCTCIAELVPTDDPHLRRLVVTVPDPECEFVPHRVEQWTT
jgi:hypothetical protein